MKSIPLWLSSGLLAVLAIAAVSCGGGPAAPTSTPYATRTPLPTFTARPNTPPTPIPTPTSVAAVATAPPARPADINPFTGLKVDPAKLQRRPLAIKIENHGQARPQTGFLQADLVYEYLMEYGFTRFLAIFLTEEPEKVGPVRSARPIDIPLVRQHDAVLVDSGASIQVDQMLAEATDIVRLSDAHYADPYFYRVKRGADVAYEHTLYTNVVELRKLLQSLGQEKAVPQRGFLFSEAAPQGQPVAKITIIFSESNTTVYTYHPASKLYQRQVNGKDFLDEATGQVIAHRNLIVQFAQAEESILVDSPSGRIRLHAYELMGEGRAILFRDGVMVEGRWQHSNPHEMTRFVDGAGREVQLGPGQTWILVAPEGTAVKTE